MKQAPGASLRQGPKRRGSLSIDTALGDVTETDR